MMAQLSVYPLSSVALYGLTAAEIAVVEEA